MDWHGDGWLLYHGYQDFAGSGIVHTLGGVCAGVGCYFMKPRFGRFTKDGRLIDMPGHSVPLAGTLSEKMIYPVTSTNTGYIIFSESVCKKIKMHPLLKNH